MTRMTRREFGRGTAASAALALHGLAMAQTREIGQDALRRLRTRFRGELVAPGFAGYEEARNSWNRRFDRHPALVAVCLDGDDVLRALEYANGAKLPVAVRGGGHSLAALSSCDRGVVIDLGRMNTVAVDGTAKLARFGAGARIGAVQAAAAAKGLVAVLPSSAEVGAGGAVLAAGVGDLTGYFGNSAAGLMAAACILPDGRRVRVDKGEHQDLLWGLRGAGANLAIATELTVRLFPAPQVYEFTIVCPTEAMADMAHRMQAVGTELRERISGSVAAFGAAGKPAQGVVEGIFFGSEVDGKAVMARLTRGMAVGNAEGKAKQHAATTAISPSGRSHYAVTRWATGMQELPEEVIKRLFDLRVPLPFERFVTLNSIYGTDTRARLEDAAWSGQAAGVNLGLWADANSPEGGDAAAKWVGDLWEVAGGERYGGLPSLLQNESAERLSATYGRNFDRLKRLKTACDPNNVLRGNPYITPISV